MQALHLVAGGVIVFLLGAGALAAVSVRARHERTPAATAGTVSGPERGTPVAGYIASRAGALAGAKGRVTAIVSFRTYQPDVRVRVAVAHLPIDRYLVAAPGGDPADTGDVQRWREGLIRSVTGEISEFEQMLPSLKDTPDFEQQSRQDLENDRRMLEALRARAPVVFAIVVHGDAAALRRLAHRAEIRLVDVVDRSAERGAGVVGLRPEETIAAGDPPARPTA